jgi:dienelactone hydrolase
MPITRARLIERIGLAEPAIALLATETVEHAEYVVEILRFRLGDAEVRGFLTRPLTAGPHPAILYGHSHGGRYDIGAAELLDGREYLQTPYGAVLARAGYVTLSLDMQTFGSRNGVTESAAAKALLWYGKSLFGQMLSDHAAALTWLASRADVDADRIAALGMSMGCTLSYWLAAMDPRLKVVAQLCCFADQRTMIEMGAHDGHGIYMTVPGLLAETDAGDIAALVAPRPQLVTIGEADRLTPPLAVARAWAQLEPAYAEVLENLQLVSEPGIGHEETPAMRSAVMAFLAGHL